MVKNADLVLLIFALSTVFGKALSLPVHQPPQSQLHISIFLSDSNEKRYSQPDFTLVR